MNKTEPPSNQFYSPIATNCHAKIHFKIENEKLTRIKIEILQSQVTIHIFLFCIFEYTAIRINKMN